MGLSVSTPQQAAERTHLISFDEASRLIALHARPLGTESVPIEAADRRILAKPAVARRQSPVTLVSAMDGYAVRESDLAQLPATLAIAGKSFAGAGFGSALPAHSCVRIFTGAPAPIGTDRIVMQEDVREGDGVAIFALPLSPRRHLRLAGSDFREGEILVSAGSILTPQRLIGIAAAGGAPPEEARRYVVSLLGMLADTARRTAPEDFGRLVEEHQTKGGLNERVRARLLAEGWFDTAGVALAAGAVLRWTALG